MGASSQLIHVVLRCCIHSKVVEVKMPKMPCMNSRVYFTYMVLRICWSVIRHECLGQQEIVFELGSPTLWPQEIASQEEGGLVQRGGGSCFFKGKFPVFLSWAHGGKSVASLTLRSKEIEWNWQITTRLMLDGIKTYEYFQEVFLFFAWLVVEACGFFHRRQLALQSFCMRWGGWF